jgi:hypothetical protein
LIDVLIPVLGRPQNAAAVVDAVHAGTVTHAFRILFICNKGDDAQIAACQATGEDVMTVAWESGPHDYPAKMNAAYQQTDGEWLLLGADDIVPQRCWAKTALERAGDRYHVIATNDRANRQVMGGLFGTHCLVRRSYVFEQGASYGMRNTLFHEGYDHNFCDRELCGVARDRGVYTFSKESVIQHLHPNWRTAKNDDTYRKGRENFKADLELFLTRSRLWGYHGLTSQEVRMARTRNRRRSSRR